MPAQSQTMHVYEAVKKKIDEGVYSPAESLREAALAEEYGASRNTIKKALLMLENDAYVTIEQNKGARVRSYSKAEVLEFLELRENLEGFVSSTAAAVISEDSLNAMKNILEKMKERKAAGDLLGYSALNREFHTVLYDACPNRMAVDMLVRLKNQMKKYNSKSVLIPGRIDHSFEEHTAIYQALCLHDASAVQKLMQHHIRNVRDTYEQYYGMLF
ncbi:MAG: GntR family transcriptional regulator [Clostridia bacterium]|nr:GntR family transcriptional regulator [Clostridia bacterium]